MNRNDVTIFNKIQNKARRKELRNNMTEPEKRIWALLNHQKMGKKFRRQHGIGYYIVDFYCPELKLVIEIDGNSHFTDDAKEYDKIRDDYLAGLNITTLRFTNTEVMQQIESVYQRIQEYITQSLKD